MADDLRIFRALSASESEQTERRSLIPPPPPWRVFTSEGEQQRGSGFILHPDDKSTLEVVNAALCLRRPILLEGGPGLGKTTLAYAVAHELGLPGPFRWSITSRSVLREGLYLYDAVGRFQAANLAKFENADLPEIGDFLRLGPLGMGIRVSEPKKPAVVLIDEIDKGDQDLPNDLLHLFEEGYFDIPEVQRMQAKKAVPVHPFGVGRKLTIPREGRVKCREFPFIILTSNGERSFPGPFLRRCLRLRIALPKGPALQAHLRKIIEARFSKGEWNKLKGEASLPKILSDFEKLLSDGKRDQSVDQLLNAMHLLLRGDDVSDRNRDELRERVFANLRDS